MAGTISLVIAGSVDYRQVLLRVIVPFGTLLAAYKYTQARTRGGQHSTPAAQAG